jgi:hypothetical protein
MNVFAFFRSQIFIENIKNKNKKTKNKNTNIIDNDLVPYFHIQKSSFNKFNKFNIYFDIKQSYCLLTINYYIKPKIDYIKILSSLHNFGYDICYYINEYIIEHLYLQFKILFPINYPTFHSKWIFCYHYSSIPYNSREHGNMTLYNYYKYITKIYNEKNHKNKSHLNVENEVLSFILYIHCMNNCLLDYCYEN